MIQMSTSFRNFLQNSDCRVAQILFNAYYCSFPAYRLMITTDQINYITFRTDGTISYLPAKKEHIVNEDGTWNRKNRQNGSPGKVIRKLFTPKALKILKDSDFECFNNEYKAKYNDDGFKFELWDRNKIPTAYEMKRRKGGGSLNNSCMHYGYNISEGQDDDDDDDTWSSEWFEIYRNCKHANILVLIDKQGLLCGRALVWKLADGVTIMDRVYTSHDFMYDLFLNYASENEWLRKVDYKSKDGKTHFMQPNGVTIYKNFRIETDTDFDYYPYIDTFTYGNSTGIQNYPSGTTMEFNCTDGSYQGEPDDDDNDDDHSNQRWDEIDERWIDEDDAVTIERGTKRNYCTHRDNTVEVGAYTYWDQDPDITYLDYDDQWHLKSDVVYSEHDGCDYPEDECVDSNRGWILESDATEIDGKWYHDDDVVYSKYSKENYRKEDCIWSEYHKSHILKDDAVKVGDDWIHVDEAPKEETEKNWIDIDDRVTNPHDPNQLKLELQH